MHLGVLGGGLRRVALLAFRAMLPGDDDADRERRAEAHRPTACRPRAAPDGARAVLGLAALGVLAACGAFVEDAGASWSALYLRTELAAGAARRRAGVRRAAGRDDRRPAHR